MKRVMAIVATLALVLGFAAPAEAASKWFPISNPYHLENTPYEIRGNFGYNFNLEVSPQAKLTNNGYGVSWPVTLRCPKKESYQLHMYLSQIGGPYIPDIDDLGVPAAGVSVGKCNGKNQKVTVKLEVQRNRSWSRKVPMTAEANGWYPFVLYFEGPSFGLNVCRNPACA